MPEDTLYRRSGKLRSIVVYYGNIFIHQEKML